MKPYIVEQYNWHMGYVDNSENIIEKLESKESSVIGDSSKDSKEGSSQGELRCLEAPQGATGKNPCWQQEGEAPISLEQHLSSRERRLNWTW